jgi:hypothetical protein
MKKHLLLLILACTLTANAQDDKTVTLTVTGTGERIEDAKTNALRSAIEQAFGAFISSKTDVLNDELIKDEIVSISNGNIQKFDVISQIQSPNGSYAITLKATVSVEKLKSFSKSKGIKSEFNGSLFAANIIQQELNEKAEEIAVKNILKISESILKKSFNYELETGKIPIKQDSHYYLGVSVSVKLNDNFKIFREYFQKSMNSLSMTSSDVDLYLSQKKPVPIFIQIDPTSENKYNKIYLRSDNSLILIDKFLTITLRNIIYNFEINNGLFATSGQNLYDRIEYRYGDTPKLHNAFVSYDTFEPYFQIVQKSNHSAIYSPEIINRTWSSKDNSIIDGLSMKNVYFPPINSRTKYLKRREYLKKLKRDDKGLLNKLIICNFHDLSNKEELVAIINYNDKLMPNELKKITEYTIKPKG